MWEFQISVCRVLTPEEGQKKLAEMDSFIKDNVQTTGAVFGVIKIPGITIDKSPFPGWFDELVRKHIPDIKFNDINFLYYKVCADQAEAEKLSEWLLVELKVWAEHDPEKALFFKGVQSRLLDRVDDAETGVYLY